MSSLLPAVTNQRLCLKYIFDIFAIQIRHANVPNDLCMYAASLG